jgi:ferritin-like metal-binding protein YciE
MAEPTARDAKLIQYLNEAYGKEKELVTALQAHISLTTRDAYKKRLKDHLGETKAQAKGLERRIKQLGGKAETVELPGPEVIAETAAKAQAAAQKALAAAKGPLHAIRGTSEPETMLKNAKTEFFNEAEEIANYHAIEALAEALGDRDTAKLAREFRRQEERMAKFLEKTITSLTKEVVRTEIPASERNGGKSSGSAKRSSGNGRPAAKKPAAAKRTAAATKRTTTATAKRTASTTKRKPTAAKRKAPAAKA